MVTLSQAVGIKGTASKLYAQFTVVDPVLGSLTFLIGDMTFQSGSSIVYRGISDWGALPSYMAVDGRSRNGQTSIDLIGNCIVIPSNGVTVYTIAQILRTMPMWNVQITFYQWNELATAQSIWSGFCRNIEMKDQNGISVFTINISQTSADASAIISDVTTSAPAPTDSFGKMTPRAYGIFRSGLTASDTNSPSPAVIFGYGSKFLEGVVVDQNQTSMQMKVRFSKNDGLQGWHSFQESTGAGSAYLRGDIWIWIPSLGTYAQVDAGSTVVTNNSTETSVLIEGNPLVAIPLRPNATGTRMNAAPGTAFLATAYKLIDDDPTNYLETTANDYYVSFEIPPVSIPGFQCSYVVPVLRVGGNGTFSGTRDYHLTIWDDTNNNGGLTPDDLGNAGKDYVSTGNANTFSHIKQEPSGGYVASDFDNHVGSSTISEFSSGRFIGRDATNNDVPLQVFFFVSSASKDGLRVYDMGAVAVGRLAMNLARRSSRVAVPKRLYDPQGRFKGIGTELQTVETVVPTLGDGAIPFKYLASGNAQKDGTGTFDTNGFSIRNAAGVAHHLLAQVGGMAVNTTSGTVGNFTDAKVEVVTGEKNFDPWFGPNTVSTVEDAKDLMQSRYPMRLHQESGVWQIIMDEVNPHTSRFYRSTSDVVRVSAKRHLIRGSLKTSHLPFENICNSTTLNYGHAFGSNRPLRTYQYQNYLSNRLFGSRPGKPIDEPWITADTLDTDTEAAKYLAKYSSWVFGRPRLIVSCRLTEEFFDLKIGHVLTFDSDMEDVGLTCPAYRLGKLDYEFERGSAVTNYADSATPLLLPGGSVSGSAFFFTSSQISGLTFGIPGGGAYTTVANGWKYFDGTTMTALSNVKRSDGGDPLAVFKASAGTYSVTWDMPNPHLVRKTDGQLGASFFGPCYLYWMEYSISTAAVTGTSQTVYTPKWNGLLFEVLEVSRKPGVGGSYPYVEVVLQEGI